MSILETLIGPPMAAPETKALRRLRLAVVSLAASTAAGIVALGPIVAVIGRVAAGGALAVLIATLLMVGTIYFVRKVRIDARWLLDRGFDRGGEGA